MFNQENNAIKIFVPSILKELNEIFLDIYYNRVLIAYRILLL
jgi:hypothetical protein